MNRTARTTRTVTALAAAATGAGLLVAAAPAGNAAASGVEKVRYGSCTQGSTWKLELEKEHGYIDVDFEAETGKVGAIWRVKITHTRIKNNRKWVHRSTTRSDRDGEVDVDRHLRDRKGRDGVVVRIKNRSSGEVCRASLTI